MKTLIVVVIVLLLGAMMLLPTLAVSACPTATPTHTATPTATATATQPPKLGPVQLYFPWVHSPAAIVLVQPTPTATPGERVCSHPSDPTCKDD